MKKITIIAILCTLLSSLVLFGCSTPAPDDASTDEPSSSEDESTIEAPEGFDFRIVQRAGIVYDINTYDDYYKGTETIELTIPGEQMVEFYKLFKENDLESLPSDINGDVDISEGEVSAIATPGIYYSITYTSEGVTRTIICDTGGPWEAEGPPESYVRFFVFVDAVNEYLYSLEEIQNMPLPDKVLL